MKTIVLWNMKGGTGKTTTALNLAFEFSAEGKAVLCIDLDGQCKTYTIQGRLLVKETGEELLVDGEPVTAELQFVPEEPDGRGMNLYRSNFRF